VTDLDLAGRTAYAVPTDASYYTQTKEIEDLRIIKPIRNKSCGPVKVYLGEVEVTTTVVGFKKKAQFTEEVSVRSHSTCHPSVFPPLPSGLTCHLKPLPDWIRSNSTLPAAYTLLSIPLSLSFPCLPCATAMILVVYLLPCTPIPAEHRYLFMTPTLVASALPRGALTW